MVSFTVYALLSDVDRILKRNDEKLQFHLMKGYVFMKILVFSDSHGNISRMKDALEAHLPSCKLIIHLGDGGRDIEYLSSLYPEIHVISLKGNGETISRDTRLFDEMGVRFFCMHGHSYGVKSGIESAATEAKNNGADILLYGHTHVCKIYEPGSDFDDYKLQTCPAVVGSQPNHKDGTFMGCAITFGEGKPEIVFNKN